MHYLYADKHDRSRMRAHACVFSSESHTKEKDDVRTLLAVSVVIVLML